MSPDTTIGQDMRISTRLAHANRRKLAIAGEVDWSGGAELADSRLERGGTGGGVV